MNSEKVALFVAGVAAGIALHRLIMALILDHGPDDKCAYCEWLGRKEGRRKMRRRKH